MSGAGMVGKKIRGRKRHLMVDTEGWPLEIWVTGADATDREIEADLLEEVKQRIPTLRKVWVDSAYAGLVEEVGREIGVQVEVVRRPRGQRGSPSCLGAGSLNGVLGG